ncbi:MAG: radical SAM protein [Megasphaera sp.]|jgi:MoaA/NifB/PqqE/SkfB family radical SAM enzyme|nr:radical SAM protein [Megasphaera sp.]MCH4188002.1 radical SAM protein [Megasphaera sp.]MCH4217722.1 radical SAM protein [Megasphaera sp.]
MKLVHEAEMKSVEVLVDHILKEKDLKDRQKTLLRLTDIMEKYFGSLFEKESFDGARQLIRGDGKWLHFLNRALNELDPHVVKTSIMNLGFEAGFYGLQVREDAKNKYHCNIPWAILFDPTSACNLHCIGCWAAEYGHTLNLTYDTMCKIVTEGRNLGVHFYLLTGGEPLVRKADVLRLCRQFKDCEFHAFTNGTLVDEAFCQDMQKVGNLSLSISLEGFEEVNDSRRGHGSFQKVMEAMDLLHKHGLVFGTSICYTSKNIDTVTSDAFLDMIISKGVWYTWYFHYMPVGNDASLDLLPTKEQREYMVRRVREIRSVKGGKPIFAMDFQNDGQFVDGCVAGGRNYCHINPNGDVEPCVFIHYSSANINDKSLLECLQQPLFQEYGRHQPFNKNHLRPCPMLENPTDLIQMVHASGAKSTDMQSPESVEHLCGKCMKYAKEWAPAASKVWDEIESKEEKETKSEASAH